MTERQTRYRGARPTKTLIFSAVMLLCCTSGTLAPAQTTSTTARILERPIVVERGENVTTVPLTPHMGKLSIEAVVDGRERRFLFDTGSPSMISRDLANELELEILGTNTGRDANGRELTTDIALVDRLEIGTATFRSVPVLIADFSVSDPNGCFFEGGVIGSEIFPGNVVHIDPESRTLRIAANVGDLGAPVPAAPAVSARLHAFGYPHPPVFDYAVGGFEDRGLFDTGHSGTVVLFERVAQDPRVWRAMVPGTVRRGRGSHGVSAAGLGPETDLLRFEIEGLRLGETRLERRRGTIRGAPPSLIGLGILRTHAVTLDYSEARLLLHPRSSPEPAPTPPGYGLMASAEGVKVVQLFTDSAAQRAGLRLGDQVVKIGDRELPLADATCATNRWLIEASPTQSAGRITVLRKGKRRTIDLAGSPVKP